MKNLTKIIFGIACISVCIACARIGQVPGGPIDEDPPIVIKAKPSNYSTNYNQNKIFFGFDEFVTLNNVFGEFTISPPIEEKPFPLTKGKGIVVKLPASQLDSFTYTLDFGQSIADNNEGNLLPNFQFVVSKMPHIDSFSVSGKIVDAFNHQPDKEGMFIYLNRNLSDTVPYTTIPSYLGKTSPEGNFTINHIAPATYSIFALKDANSNMLFDMPTEVIGFSDEPVTFHPDSFPIEPEVEHIHTDSLHPDSSAAINLASVKAELSNINLEDANSHDFDNPRSINDSTENDSIKTDSVEIMVYGYSINLYSFAEEIAVNQFLSEYKRPEREQLLLIFNDTLENKPEVRLIEPDSYPEDWHLLEASKNFDTLTYWLPDSSLIMNDSLLVEVTYPETDTTGVLVSKTDTLLFRSKAVKEKKGKESKQKSGGLLDRFSNKEKEEEAQDTVVPPPPRMKFSHNVKGTHDLYRNIVINPGSPVFDYDFSKVELFKLEDTLQYAVRYKTETDSLKFRQAVIKVNYEAGTSYILKLHEGAFADIYGRTIDSTEIKFKTQEDDYYGYINIALSNIVSPVILQLMDEKEKVIKQEFLSANKTVLFEYLKPGKYKFKLIYDTNNNGRWDTGDLKLRIQPEYVSYFPTEMDVRSNWTLEYDWEIEQ